MFTGIVEQIGTIVESRGVSGGRRLRVDVGPIAAECKLGDSLSISGVCLTVAAIQSPLIDFDVIKETLDKSALGRKNTGDVVNIERSLRVGDRLDGHFVQGHVDGTAGVERVVATPAEHVLHLRPDDVLRPYLIPKGSVALDGVSLTIADVDDDLFSVALIPTTLERTTLSRLSQGDIVNVETDMIVRAIVHRMEHLTEGGGLTMDSLRKAGFA
jgi:riboflavin synthase